MHTVHVQAVAAEEMKWPNGTIGTMKVVLHEAQHLSDSANHRIRTGLEVGLRLGSFQIGAVAALGIANLLPGPEFIDRFIKGLLPVYSRMKYYKIDPAERRARKFAAREELMEQYGDAISF